MSISPGEKLFGLLKEDKRSIYTFAHGAGLPVAAVYDLIYEGPPLNERFLGVLTHYYPDVEWFELNLSYMQGQARVAVTNLESEQESEFGYVTE